MTERNKNNLTENKRNTIIDWLEALVRLLLEMPF